MKQCCGTCFYSEFTYLDVTGFCRFPNGVMVVPTLVPSAINYADNPAWRRRIAIYREFGQDCRTWVRLRAADYG